MNTADNKKAREGIELGMWWLYVLLALCGTGILATVFYWALF